jgi:tRNA 2-selenouridine synthase
MATRSAPIEEFLDLARTRTVFDVRTPAEYEHGRLPGAVNLPLFTNAERAEIGTLYAHAGRNAALKRGLELTGPRLREYIERAESSAREGAVLVHCWRGGMRSGAMAWLLSFYGLDVVTLSGGYKSFRRYLLGEVFQRTRRYIVLAGRTGAGKTQVLQELKRRGERVVDLEALARHRGSSFGQIGLPPAPGQEQFENELGLELHRLDFPHTDAHALSNDRIWIEDESKKIGCRVLPAGLHAAFFYSPIFYIDRPLAERAARLAQEYGEYNLQELSEAIVRIRKRLGGQDCSRALEALHAGDLTTACTIVLTYYDRTYEYGLARRAPRRIRRFEAGATEPAEIAAQLIDYAEQTGSHLWTHPQQNTV